MEPLDPVALGAFLALGLTGSPHCAGMCSGFVLTALAPAGAQRRRALQQGLLFATGKATTYTLLGALGIALVARLPEDLPLLGELRRFFSALVGLWLVLAGLALLAPRPRRPRSQPWLRLPLRVLEHWKAGVEALGGWAGAFGSGMVVGLLPCGLSWSALALATQTSAPTALLGLFLFGLGTAPLLVSLGVLGRTLAPRLRSRVLALAGLSILAFGARTLHGVWSPTGPDGAPPLPCHAAPLSSEG